MSYNCTISFKQIPGNKVFEFLQSFKKRTSEKLEEIAKENSSFSPIMKAYRFQDDFVITDKMKEDTETWAKLSIFKFRYFYNKELQLLGVYSVHRCIQDMFDLTVYFQNSCDQDYEFEEWNGVKCFEEIAEKWKNTSEEEIKKHFKEEHLEEWDPKWSSDLDYYRRSFAYDEIWKHFESTLYDDSSSLYLSLFGYYEILKMKKFVKYTEDAVEAKIEEWKREIEERKKKEEVKKNESKE